VPRSVPAKASLKADKQIREHLPIAPAKIRQAVADILADCVATRKGLRRLGAIAVTVAQFL
jgi:hypothetical protein